MVMLVKVGFGHRCSPHTTIISAFAATRSTTSGMQRSTHLSMTGCPHRLKILEEHFHRSGHCVFWRGGPVLPRATQLWTGVGANPTGSVAGCAVAGPGGHRCWREGDGWRRTRAGGAAVGGVPEPGRWEARRSKGRQRKAAWLHAGGWGSGAWR